MVTVARLPWLRRTLAVLAAAIPLALTGCEATEVALQSTLDTYWNSAGEKAKLEAEMEAQLKTGLNTALVGKKVLNLLFYDVYIHSVNETDLDIGTKSPKIKTPTSNFWGTPGHLWYSLDWTLTWAKGNGAKLSFLLDLRPAFPDHRVKIYDLDVLAKGTTLIDLNVSTGKTTVQVFTETANIDCKAEAKGWFWTIDIKDKVKKEIKKALDEKVIGKAFTKTLGI
ncbi:MAG: hypothetical protein HYZ53_28325 [Planctomycetes bacterium]|nr:hypothetical protein [Planctomycetota bacterium]